MEEDKYLFLDDYRQPLDSFLYTGETGYKDKQWDVVKNYDQFVDYIEKNGLPKVISFDHDLSPDHYAPIEYWDNYEKSKEWQDEQKYAEKTGYDCAKWLTNYCRENKLPLCEYFCHSMNPVGRDNILRELNNF